ncbi:MAG: VWA domain-containing protein [Acidobacteria bacterium]|nr:VWA domain-containing protein [Acidobacteriota bacterium]
MKEVSMSVHGDTLSPATRAERVDSKLKALLRVALLTAVAILLLIPRSSVAQEGRFSGSIEVTSVSVEVTATRRGKPVTDLTRDDFKIFEDGEERPITGFTRITGSLLPQATPVQRPTAAGPFPPSGSVRPHVVLLFDVNGAALPVLTRSVRAAIRWIEQHEAAGTLWAVAAVGTEPHLLLSYTDDIARVRDAIASVPRIPSARDLQGLDAGVASDTIRYGPTSLLGDDLGGSNIGSRLTVERLADLASWQEGKNQLARLGLLGRGLTEILRGSASIRGPKACLLFSGNIDLSPAFSDTYATSTSTIPFAHRRQGDTMELQRQLQELAQGIAQLSASAGFRIYPIAMEGLRSASDSIDLSRGGTADLRDETSGPTSMNPRSPSADWDALPLTLAEVTGGRYIRRNNIDSSLEEAYSSLKAYYILGFQSPRQASGSWRKIRVTVRRRGVHLEYRRGHYDLDREQTLAEQLTAPRLLVVDSGDFPVQLKAVSQPGKNPTTVTSTITTTLENLTFLPNGETWVARLGLLAAAYDAQGRFLVLHRGQQTVKIPAALWESVHRKKARFALSFEPPAGASQVTMALFDRTSETWGIASASIAPGTPEKPGLVNPVAGGVAIPVLRRLPSPALEKRRPAATPSAPPKSGAAAQPKEVQLSSLERWAQGPVRWLLTSEERSELAGQRSEADAARWIRLFWARRDRNPNTVENPYKKRFEERVQMADALLGEPGLRGALTERGHVLILFGRPKSRRKSADLKVDTWFYRRKDLGRLARGLKLPPVIRFQFRLDEDGHYQLKDEVPEKQREAEALSRWYPAASIVNPHLAAAPIPPLYVGVPPASSEELQRLVTAGETWPSGATAVSYPEAFPGQPPRSWVVLHIPRSLPEPDTAVGLVLDEDRTAAGSFRIELQPEIHRESWAIDLSLPVPDTRSSLMLAILSGGDIVAHRKLSLRIPIAPPQATVITPAVLGTRLRELVRYTPWTTNLFGGYHLDPNIDGRFLTTDTVYLFFNVIRPRHQPGTPPVVDVGLRILRGEKTVAAAHWNRKELSMMSPETYLFGSSFALSAIDRPGAYTLELTVREPASHTVQITTFPITIEEP